MSQPQPADGPGADGTGQPVLSLDGVGISYALPIGGRLVVLSDFAVEVDAGELVVIAGRSGSGKTTALQIAGGLLPPEAGEVRWMGRPTSQLSGEEMATARRKMIGIVFQTGGLIEQLTAAENVALAELPRSLSTSGRQRARDMLQLVGLGPRAQHFPAQLSGGERQRVAIARALFGDPQLLIVDEPTSNLDRRTADEVIELLISLSDSRALLIASHDQQLIARASRTVTLD